MLEEQKILPETIYSIRCEHETTDFRSSTFRTIPASDRLKAEVFSYREEGL